jgi:hypothetical protein
MLLELGRWRMGGGEEAKSMGSEIDRAGEVRQGN